MQKRNVEYSVGLFVVVGIFLLGYIVFSMGGLKFNNEGYTLHVLFGFTSGVDAGAPVRLAGIKVGEVKDVCVVPSESEGRYLVDLKLWIDKKVKVEKNSTFTITALNLFGKKYVEITPGTLGSAVYEPNSKLRGQDPLVGDDFKQQMEDISKQFGEVADRINGILKDEEMITNLKSALKNSKPLVDKLMLMADNANATFTNLSSKIDQVFGDKEAIENFKIALKNSKFLVEDYRKIAQNANDIVLKIKSGEGTIGKLIYEEEVYENIKEFSRVLRYQPWKLLQKPKEDSKVFKSGPTGAK